MMPAFIIMGCIIYITLQTRQSRQPVWRNRFEALTVYVGPVARKVYWDVRAIRQWHTRANYRLVYNMWKFRRSL